jgi:hypothetical protein
VEPAPSGPAPSEGAPAARPDSDCDVRKGQVAALLKEAGRCKIDADCTTLMPGCPFGCTQAIHRATNVPGIEAEIASYNADCNRCVYRCRPVERPPTCSAGFCSVE